MEEFEEGSIDTGLPISKMIQRSKQSKGKKEEDYKEIILNGSLPTSEVVITRKKPDQTKPETFRKRKTTRNNKERGVGEEGASDKKHDAEHDNKFLKIID